MNGRAALPPGKPNRPLRDRTSLHYKDTHCTRTITE